MAVVIHGCLHITEVLLNVSKLFYLAHRTVVAKMTEPNGQRSSHGTAVLGGGECMGHSSEMALMICYINSQLSES